ncbi:MAG TPA: 5-formyltetrahydrofolate cyclo-ligase [Pirellulales bacterium]|jgi:5-formyltetrahydrofolate cyclo-ligase|nr:5-formyltetrahydrofolate cyclo-ligase [Pirellulales bacterium]
MAEEADQSLVAFKQSIRECARDNRRAQPGKDQLSRLICRALAELPEYVAARSVLFYVDVRAEVRTQHFLPTALAEGKQVVVPYCNAGRLELFRLESMTELAGGSFQILEPRPELRSQSRRRISIDQVDLVIVPGVAFDRDGARLGHGLGYYDKLLAGAREQTPRVALAFDCQIFPTLPTAPHDVPMHIIVTERAVYRVGQTPVPLASL